MSAFASNGKVVGCFQGAFEPEAGYATLGFSGAADPGQGAPLPVAFAVKELTGAAEARGWSRS